MAQAPPLTVLFHGSFGACRKDGPVWMSVRGAGANLDYACPVLLVASLQHSAGLSWVDWITITGLPLTILGLVLTWWQAREAANSAKAAQRAIRETEQEIRAKQVMVLVPQLRWTLHEIDTGIESSDPRATRRSLDSWRMQASNIHGILSGTFMIDKRILKNLSKGVALAGTASDNLLKNDGSVLANCLEARKAITVISDDLATWVGRHSTQGTPVGGDE